MTASTHLSQMRAEMRRLSARMAELEARLAPVPPPRTITVAQILDEVSAEFALPPEQIMSRWLVARVLPARHAVMALARRHTALSFPQIGRVLMRDHTTVINGAEAHARREMADPIFAARMRAVSERLQRSIQDA